MINTSASLNANSHPNTSNNSRRANAFAKLFQNCLSPAVMNRNDEGKITSSMETDSSSQLCISSSPVYKLLGDHQLKHDANKHTSAIVGCPVLMHQYTDQPLAPRSIHGPDYMTNVSDYPTTTTIGGALPTPSSRTEANPLCPASPRRVIFPSLYSNCNSTKSHVLPKDSSSQVTSRCNTTASSTETHSDHKRPTGTASAVTIRSVSPMNSPVSAKSVVLPQIQPVRNKRRLQPSVPASQFNRGNLNTMSNLCIETPVMRSTNKLAQNAYLTELLHKSHSEGSLSSARFASTVSPCMQRKIHPLMEQLSTPRANANSATPPRLPPITECLESSHALPPRLPKVNDRSKVPCIPQLPSMTNSLNRSRVPCVPQLPLMTNSSNRSRIPCFPQLPAMTNSSNPSSVPCVPQLPSMANSSSFAATSHLPPSTPPSASRTIFLQSPTLNSPHFSPSYYVQPKPFDRYLEEQREIKAAQVTKEQGDKDFANLASRLKPILRNDGRFLGKCKAREAKKWIGDVSQSFQSTETASSSDTQATDPATLTPVSSVESNITLDCSVSDIRGILPTFGESESFQDSEPETGEIVDSDSSKRASFDPRVWVREFERDELERRSTWYKPEDMIKFKNEALERIIRYHQQHNAKLVPTGTGRMMLQKQQPSKSDANATKALFSHQALRMDYEYEFNYDSILDAAQKHFKSLKNERRHEKIIEDDCKLSQPLKPSPRLHEDIKLAVADREVRNILVVDPIQICILLFSKSLRQIFPNAEITAARTSEEALQKLQNTNIASNSSSTHSFDLILIEARLNLLHEGNEEVNQSTRKSKSGSALLRQLASVNSSTIAGHEDRKIKHCVDGETKESRQTLRIKDSPARLLIGCTTNLQEDRSQLVMSGADFVWGKPPPLANATLRDELLCRLLEKRGQYDLAQQLFSPKQESKEEE